jgi:RNA polymerase sporulation-specific sigma factor
MDEITLVLRSCDGDSGAFAALAAKHRPLLRHIVSRYYLVGGDRQDLEQEALLGLHKACMSYDCSGRSGFTHFAALCVEHQVIAALKAATCGKHGPLNDSVRFERPIQHDDEEGTLGDLVAGPQTDDPAIRAEHREDLRRILYELPEQLTDLQRTVFERAWGGATLQEAGQDLGQSYDAAKTADNALGRIRSKARVLLEVAA